MLMEQQNNYQKRHYICAVLLVLAVCLFTGTVSAQTAPTMRTVSFGKTDPYCTGSYHTDLGGTYTDATLDCLAITIAADKTIPNTVVDWVLVELRAVTRSAGNSNDAISSSAIARKPALLLNNGRVVDAKMFVDLTNPDITETSCVDLSAANTNCPDILFNEGNITGLIGSKDLYIVIRHRNHLDIMSSSAVTGASGTYTYDFSSAATQARASKLASKSSTFALIAGDADKNFEVGLADYTGVVVGLIGNSGYFDGDVDFNGEVSLSDFTGILSGNIGNSTDIRF